MISIFHSSLLQLNDWPFLLCAVSMKKVRNEKLSQYFFVSSFFVHFQIFFYCCCYIYVSSQQHSAITWHCTQSTVLLSLLNFFGVFKIFRVLQNFYLIFSLFLLLLFIAAPTLKNENIDMSVYTTQAIADSGYNFYGIDGSHPREFESINLQNEHETFNVASLSKKA